MFSKVRLDEVVTPAMLERHREHIVAFLEQEGITIDCDDLGATQLTDRQVKELLEELAEGVG
jgi:arsenate reductase-like glutaredoxin family protein